MIEILRKKNLWLFFGIPLFFALLTTNTSAQTLANISLDSIPRNPGPSETTTVSLNQYGVNTLGATIRWYINDVEQSEYKNDRKIMFVTDDLGEQTVVKVSVIQNNGITLTSSKIFTPALVDIILESDTYIPYFYSGRALPSTGANVRAVAVVNDGTNMPPSSYTYRWSIDNSVLFGGPITGKNVAEFSIPRFGKELVSVEVTNKSGNIIAESYLPIKRQKPVLHFYEENPLLGLREKEIGDKLNLLGEETTIFGEPYYMSTTLDDYNMSFKWKIDGQSVLQNTVTPNALTLSRVGDSGSAQISLEILVKSSTPQLVSGAFGLLFD